MCWKNNWRKSIIFIKKIEKKNYIFIFIIYFLFWKDILKKTKKNYNREKYYNIKKQGNKKMSILIMIIIFIIALLIIYGVILVDLIAILDVFSVKKKLEMVSSPIMLHNIFLRSTIDM